jgi:hypothetical protein
MQEEKKMLGVVHANNMFSYGDLITPMIMVSFLGLECSKRTFPGEFVSGHPKGREDISEWGRCVKSG